MTLQESARARAMWAGQVGALFIFAGGAVGGAFVGAVMYAVAVFSNPSHFLGFELVPQLLGAILFTSLFGVPFGFPASLATGATYVALVGMRKRWALTAFGTLASGLWGAIFLGSISPAQSATQSYFVLTAFFAGAGAIATLACYSLMRRLQLTRP